MELVKTFALVAVAAAGGAVAGGMAADAVNKRLPTDTKQSHRDAMRVGLQAASSVAVFAVLKAAI